MQINFLPEQEAQLAFDATSHFRSAVRAGLEQADRNELIDDDVVARWLENKRTRLSS